MTHAPVLAKHHTPFKLRGLHKISMASMHYGSHFFEIEDVGVLINVPFVVAGGWLEVEFEAAVVVVVVVNQPFFK